MSGSDNGDTKITNETTIWRRAWVDSALAGVRSRLNDSAETKKPEQKLESPARPKMYLAWSSRKTGTS